MNKDNTYIIEEINFNLSYGLINFYILLEYSDIKIKLYSSFCAIATNSRYTFSSESISKMLKYIYENDNRFLVQKTEENNRFISQSGNIYKGELSFLNSIIDTFYNLINHFRTDYNNIKISNCDLLDIEKIHNISFDSLSYISRHPEELKSNESGVIEISKKNLLLLNFIVIKYPKLPKHMKIV